MSDAFNDDIFFVYESYKKHRNASALADFIRIGGLINKPWPVGLAEDLADLIDEAYPWTARKQTRVDDTWIFYIYWKETEFKTGRLDQQLNKSAIRYVEEWFNSRGTPKNYETIRTRLRDHYSHWRNSLKPEEIEKMTDAARGGEKS
jgi:hypothetical protein